MSRFSLSLISELPIRKIRPIEGDCAESARAADLRAVRDPGHIVGDRCRPRRQLVEQLAGDGVAHLGRVLRPGSSSEGGSDDDALFDDEAGAAEDDLDAVRGADAFELFARLTVDDHVRGVRVVIPAFDV